MWQKIRLLFDRSQREEKRLDVVRGLERKPVYPGILAKRLASYTPCSPLHVGPASDLTDTQIDENFAAFMAAKPERLRMFSALLLEFGIDCAPLLNPQADASPTIQEIEKWMADYLPERKHLPPWKSMVNAPIDLYRRSARAGSEIIFSLVADYALIYGEALSLRKLKWFWGLDRDIGNSAQSEEGEAMEHYRNIVLMTKPQRNLPGMVLDLETQMLGTVYRLRSRSSSDIGNYWYFNQWLAETDKN